MQTEAVKNWQGRQEQESKPGNTKKKRLSGGSPGHRASCGMGTGRSRNVIGKMDPGVQGVCLRGGKSDEPKSHCLP